ncbi:hypothetical protein SDC9_144362 [bioreactor metagenome]|uniref:Uncharacterized protein n=1 Tax=bioreactor metagenome TaxID=1076179 RepID=A0A645E6M4_9ZZZZ
MAPHDRQAEAVAAQHARQTPQADQHAWPQPPASRLLAAQHSQHDGEAGPEIVDEPDFHGLAAVVGQAHGYGQADFIDHEQQAAAPEIGRVHAAPACQLAPAFAPACCGNADGGHGVEAGRAADGAQRLGHGTHQAHGAAPAEHGQQADERGTPGGGFSGVHEDALLKQELCAQYRQ